MSLPHRARGVKVLKAVSSPLRLQILNLLFDKSALSYTELMNQLKMNPSRDAGRFAYHLKFLLKADLVEADADAKKYYLTDLGKMVIDVADRVEKKAVKPRGMLVRTSHFTFEEFDANKIANSLIREAKMPADQAQKTSKEAEKLLTKSKIKYLTAPLIRETVNSLLIEKGLEEYRHKLTRLGLPVHEVTALIENKEHTENSEGMLATAGRTVFREYTLLNVLPRDIADAHVSGALHINGLSTWILKPNEVFHDLRFFLQNGIRLDNFNAMQLSEKPPATLDTALSTAFNVLLLAKQEVNENQTIDHFNVFLAPYAKGVERQRVKEALRLFIMEVNQHANAALGFELALPKYLAEKPAIGPNGKQAGTYADFAQEAQLLAALTLEVYAEESTAKPILNPKLIIKVNAETLQQPSALAILQNAHALAAGKGTVYFANLTHEAENNVAFSTSGVKLQADLTEEWETDTLRTGCLGYVTVNLPRIVHETEKDKTKFFDLLKERCELAARALGMKQRALKQYGKTALPFMMQSVNGDTYFRIENCSSIINLAGLKEATETFTQKPLTALETQKFAEEIIQNANAYLHKIGRKHSKRLFLTILYSLEASVRLAQLDVEKYGVAKVKFSGTREKPYYSTTRRLHLQTGNFAYVASEELDLEQHLKGLNQGGNLTIIDMNGQETKPEDLQKLTLQLMEKQTVEFLTYNRKVTYCSNCTKNWFGELHKCPSCGSMGTLVTFDRFNHT
jgi:ribonucleoside-triphosphate reductase (formate)